MQLYEDWVPTRAQVHLFWIIWGNKGCQLMSPTSLDALCFFTGVSCKFVAQKCSR